METDTKDVDSSSSLISSSSSSSSTKNNEEIFNESGDNESVPDIPKFIFDPIILIPVEKSFVVLLPHLSCIQLGWEIFKHFNSPMKEMFKEK